MRVVVAPDKFKGSLSAPQVAAHLAAGLVHAAPGTEVAQVPVADGGTGRSMRRSPPDTGRCRYPHGAHR
jgi:glycerate kinase